MQHRILTHAITLRCLAMHAITARRRSCNPQTTQHARTRTRAFAQTLTLADAYVWEPNAHKHSHTFMRSPQMHTRQHWRKSAHVPTHAHTCTHDGCPAIPRHARPYHTFTHPRAPVRTHFARSCARVHTPTRIRAHPVQTRPSIYYNILY